MIITRAERGVGHAIAIEENLRHFRDLVVALEAAISVVVLKQMFPEVSTSPTLEQEEKVREVVSFHLKTIAWYLPYLINEREADSYYHELDILLSALVRKIQELRKNYYKPRLDAFGETSPEDYRISAVPPEEVIEEGLFNLDIAIVGTLANAVGGDTEAITMFASTVKLQR